MINFRSKRVKRVLTVSLIILVAVVLSAVWPTDYYLESPGVAKDLSPLIEVENGYAQNIEGQFRLTAVSLEPASLLEYYYISFFGADGVTLTPLKRQLPSGVDPEEYFEMMQEVMKESQLKAQAVALRQAGYEPTVTGKGAKIVEILEESNARGKLKQDDIIIKVDDKQVNLLTEVVDEIRAREIGEVVKVTVKRGEKEIDYKIKTKELEETPGQASLGVLISSYQRSYDFPVEIKVDAGEIGGPSAGMMFTLEILNQLTAADLTHGYDIAGTGTITLDGKVGEISGIKQKILAAEKEGVDIFLAPDKNYEAAKETATEVKVVAIEDIQAAVQFLNSLE
ncbi:YlbL family protein [Acetohalobium arabaticum]|uniref:endopeptidase La n=1 Tax=Acetohalobium arabaticum (strain ATCC 49924 / DSM 5501 / Z-7288) TaxID=574087 RepID=D9QPT6_ACEAZ|nr:S16 family serine protease [Acetohalobium arabaticum]ADL12527.1 PDZ/DHR/GLGF domain protein [Acetohalobium arabaticum DSM 5501]